MFIRAPRRSFIVFVPQQRPAQVCHGPHHAHHSAARAVASRDASPVDMSLRRAALEVCSTSGRSLFPRALGGAEGVAAAPPASLWTQTRGKKKSTRRVEVVLHQVRAAPTPRPTAPVNYAARSPLEFWNAIRSRTRGPRGPAPAPAQPLIRKKPVRPPSPPPIPGHRGTRSRRRDRQRAPRSRAQSPSYPLVWRYTLMPINSRTPRAAARVWEGEIAEMPTRVTPPRERYVLRLGSPVHSPRSTRTFVAPRVFARTRRIRGSISRRLDAVMSNYYFETRSF